MELARLIPKQWFFPPLSFWQPISDSSPCVSSHLIPAEIQLLQSGEVGEELLSEAADDVVLQLEVGELVAHRGQGTRFELPHRGGLDQQVAGTDLRGIYA